MAYRSSLLTVTKYSPYYLLFGALCVLPYDCMYETLLTQIFATPSDYVDNLKNEPKLCQELVQLNMKWNKRDKKFTTIENILDLNTKLGT